MNEIMIAQSDPGNKGKGETMQHAQPIPSISHWVPIGANGLYLAPPSAKTACDLRKTVTSGFLESEQLLFFDMPLCDEDVTRDFADSLKPQISSGSFRRAYVTLNSEGAINIASFIERHGFAISLHAFRLLELALTMRRADRLGVVAPGSADAEKFRGAATLTEKLMRSAEERIAAGEAVPCSVMIGGMWHRVELIGRAGGRVSRYVRLRRKSDGEESARAVAFEHVRLDRATFEMLMHDSAVCS